MENEITFFISFSIRNIGKLICQNTERNLYLLVYCEGLRHLTSMLVVGSVWSALLVLHNYGVIISECQKVTFWGVKARKILSKCEEEKKSCLKLPDSARKLIENVF